MELRAWYSAKRCNCAEELRGKGELLDTMTFPLLSLSSNSLYPYIMLAPQPLSMNWIN